MAVVAAVLSCELLYSQNTLLHNGNWVVVKRMLKVAVMGADEFLLTRSSLAGNRLDLGGRNGFQEVESRRSFRAREVLYRFSVPEGSYLDLLYDGPNGGQAGIRLSARPETPSLVFESDETGGFVRSSEFAVKLLPGKEHVARVASAGERLTVELDGRDVPLPKATLPFREGRIGFHAGWRGAWLDHVKIDDLDGSSFRENFRNDQGFLGAFLLHAILLLILLELSFFLGWRGEPALEKLKLKTLAVYTALFVSAAFSLFDFYYWSKLEFFPGMKLVSTGAPVPQLAVEEARFSFFRAWARVAGLDFDIPPEVKAQGYQFDRIFDGPVFCAFGRKNCVAYRGAAELAAVKRDPRCRIVAYLGTSQTIGSGARTLDDTFYARINEKLNRDLAPGCVETLNLSISGGNVKQVTELARKLIAAFPPSVAVLNFGNNDGLDALREGIPPLVRELEGHGVRVMLWEEANANEGPRNVEAAHPVLRKLGASLDVPSERLDAFLNSGEAIASGPLWWDHVHLSSHGQAMVAQWAEPLLLRALSQKL